MEQEEWNRAREREAIQRQQGHFHEQLGNSAYAPELDVTLLALPVYPDTDPLQTADGSFTFMLGVDALGDPNRPLG